MDKPTQYGLLAAGATVLGGAAILLIANAVRDKDVLGLPAPVQPSAEYAASCSADLAAAYDALPPAAKQQMLDHYNANRGANAPAMVQDEFDLYYKRAIGGYTAEQVTNVCGSFAAVRG